MADLLSPQVLHVCEDLPVFEQCAAVDYSGEMARYTLLRSSPATRLTTLVDFGGPGISVLSGAYRLAEVHHLLNSTNTNRNLLVVEEPWVTSSLGVACENALASLSDSIIAEDVNRITEDIGLCLGSQANGNSRQYGFKPTDYVEIVSSIEESEGISIDQFIGISFGSVRAAYLNDKLKDASIVLVDPFPVGLYFDEVLVRRADTIESWIIEAGADIGDLSDIRTASAAIAASYGGMDKFVEFISRVRAGLISAEEIDDLYRSAWNVYANSAVSLAYLAYLQEVCRLDYSGSNVDSEESFIRRVFDLYHAPCEATSPDVDFHLSAVEPDCVIVNTQDPLAIGGLTAQVYGKHRVSYADSSVPHAWIGSLSLCISDINSRGG